MDKILDGVDETQKQTFFRAINQHIADKKASEALEAKKLDKFKEVTKKREASIALIEAERAAKEAQSRLKCLRRSESSDLLEMKRLLKSYGYKY
jgi:hypothetical protein